jgi:diguanylate cyclase (GGDEF)-like protein/PAS domain S-box-containing protein
MALNKDEKSAADRVAWAFNRFDVATVAVLLAIMALLAVGRSAHYLLFHTMAELFAIVVSFSIFMLTWVGHRYLTNGYLVVLGAAYCAIGLVDIFHTLTFRGMNLFPDVSPNYTTQFWLVARFMEALALLCAPFVLSKKPNFYLCSAAFLALALGASGAVTLQIFPATFVDGNGLTPFKVYSEYLIIGMMTLALVMLYRARPHFESRIFFLLTTSLVLAVITEFSFTRYGSFYDFTNELGHYFRFLTVALAFMAIVITGVRQPMDLFFREVDLLNKKLALSEEQLNRAQHVAKVGSWYFHVPTNVHTWSQETHRMFGVPISTPLTHDRFVNCIHPQDREYVAAQWAQSLKGAPYDIEHRILVDGQVRWVREVAEVSFAADGSPLEGLGTVQDITEVKRTQDLLRDSEAFNASVFDSIIESVAVLDDQGVIISVNKPWREFALQNQTQPLIDPFVGQNYLSQCAQATCPPCSAEEATLAAAVAEGIRSVLEGRQTHFDKEYPCHSPQVQRWFHVYVSPLYGSRRGAVVSHVDITVRKLAQEQLRQSEERYRKQFSDNSAVMLMLDPIDGKIIDANAAAVAFYGYPLTQLLAMRITDINPISMDEARQVMGSVKSERGSHFQFQHRLADGSLRDVDVFSSQIVLDERKSLHVIVQDITERKRAQQAVLESEQRYRLLFDMCPDAIMLTAPDGRIFDANPAACSMFQRSKEEICRLGRNGVVDTTDPQLAVSIEVRRQTGRFAGENVFMRSDGTKFVGEVSTAMFTDREGNTRTSMIVRDISERKRIEAALQDSERRMSAVFQSSPIGIVISRIEDGKILDVNDACLRLYHCTAAQAMGRTAAEMGVYVEPQQRVAMLKLLHEQGFVEGFLIDFRRQDGATGVLEMSGRIIEREGQPCLLAMLTDVTERERSQALVHDQAFHDTLTRLPNRRLLSNRMQQAMIAAKRNGTFGALMYIDLDNFKPLNDQHGHDMGDLLLIEAAARLRGCVRESDTVARVGGDEFVIMLSELNENLAESRLQSATVAEKVRSVLSLPYRLPVRNKGQVSATIEHLCTASIGVALFVNDEADQDDLLNRADETMYQAKRSGRNAIRFYGGGQSAN